MINSTLAEVASVLKNCKNAAIICHVRPDGDAIGSGLGLTAALKNAGKRVYMLCEEEPPERLRIFPNMQTFRELPVKAEGIDLIVSVDCADVERMGSLSVTFAAHRGKTLNIDHHVSNPRFAKYNYVFPDASATCEIIPEILTEAGFDITEEVANFLALGLLTDSGNFTHADVTGKTLRVGALLREHGADLTNINYLEFTRQSKARALLYGRVVSRIRFELGDKLAFLTVTQKDLNETGTDKSQTEGFVDFPLSIDGVEVSISLLEVHKNQYKASLRSKRLNVNEVAARFGGGGHVLASGCMLSGEYEEVVERLTYAVSLQL